MNVHYSQEPMTYRSTLFVCGIEIYHRNSRQTGAIHMYTYTVHIEGSSVLQFFVLHVDVGEAHRKDGQPSSQPARENGMTCTVSSSRYILEGWQVCDNIIDLGM